MSSSISIGFIRGGDGGETNASCKRFLPYSESFSRLLQRHGKSVAFFVALRRARIRASSKSSFVLPLLRQFTPSQCVFVWGVVGTRRAESNQRLITTTARQHRPVTRAFFERRRVPESARVTPPAATHADAPSARVLEFNAFSASNLTTLPLIPPTASRRHNERQAPKAVLLLVPTLP